MDDSKRTRLGFLGSLAFHLVIFLLVAATGVFAVLSQTNEGDDIVDVSVYDGGGTGPGTGGGGGGGGGNGGAEAVINPAGTTAAAAAKSTDTITENAKTDTVSTTQPAAETSASEQGQQDAAGSGADGSGSGDSAGTGGGSGGGNGTGQGTGNGSGQGPGSGSGSGGGNGSGHGTGNGSGNGPGDGGGGTVDLSDRPHVVSSSLPVIPQSALQRGPHSARMVVAIVVGTGGGVDSVAVISSTGYADLDTAGINAAYSYSFTPARDRYGQPRRARVQIPISFRVR